VNTGQADALPEKPLLKRQHDALNELADLMKRYDDRLTLECRNHIVMDVQIVPPGQQGRELPFGE